MNKANLGKTISNVLTKIGTKTAVNSTKEACPVFAYQPKCPKSLKKSAKWAKSTYTFLGICAFYKNSNR